MKSLKIKGGEMIMKKTPLASVIAILIILLFTTYASAAYIDVSPDDYGYTAIMELSSKGVLSGYLDGSFRPDGLITRTEAAAVITRADGSASDIKPGVKSSYVDVPDDYWGVGYIMKATENGILSGMGDGRFCPEENVTYYQLIKMIVCMNAYNDRALSLGGWPLGYVQAAYELGYIDTELYVLITEGNIGDTAINRRQVSILVNRAIQKADAPNETETVIPENIPEEAIITVGSKKYYIGMSIDTLPAPDEIALSSFGWDWYFYGTKDYKSFIALGVKDRNVVAFQSAGPGFTYLGKSSGDTLPAIKRSSYSVLAVGDKNDNNIFHAIFVYKPVAITSIRNSAALEGECRVNFHLTNAFRVYHGKPAYIWDDRAATSARLHSEDLATNNYFSHTSLDGRLFSDRITAQEIDWQLCAENLFAGSTSGFDSYYYLVDSAGHRENILGECKKMGVGAAYNPKSTYKGYFAQNFFTEFE
jgi:uncharacterized protein YkwD